MSKFKTIILIISFIALLVLGGYLLIYLEGTTLEEDDKKQENSVEDPVLEFINNIFEESDIAFPLLEGIQFDWRYQDNEEINQLTISGWDLAAESVTSDQVQEIENIFQDNGFAVDIYNAADGTVGSMKGYIKDDIVCLFSNLISGFDVDSNDIPEQTDYRDIELRCGILENLPEVTETLEDILKKILAEKYSTKSSLVTLTIDEQTDDHVRGGVVIGPEDGLGTGGIFFAVKIDEEWNIIHDGNGAIACELLEKHNFPQNMMEDCAYLQQMKVNKDELFTITLESNATTGYQWMADFDESVFELDSQDYVAPEDSELVGAGGYDTFRFKGLQEGEYEITFSYRRSWEEEAIDEKIYTIIIK